MSVKRGPWPDDVLEVLAWACSEAGMGMRRVHHPFVGDALVSPMAAARRMGDAALVELGERAVLATVCEEHVPLADRVEVPA